MFKKNLISLATIFVSIFIVLFLFEIFLIYDNSYKKPQKIEIDVYGQNYLFINRDGIDLFYKKKSEKHNIFIVGDSFVQGLTCAAANEDLPGQLQTIIGSKARVINLGIEGMNPVEYIDWLSKISINIGDDVVIVLYDNDLHITKENCSQINRQALSYELYQPKFCRKDTADMIEKDRSTIIKKINQKLKHIKVVKLFKETLANIPLTKNLFYRSEFQSLWNQFDAEETKWMFSSLVLIDQIIRGKGANPHFTYFPNTNYISNNDPRHKIWKNFISEFESSTSIKIYDPYPYFIKTSPNKTMVWSLTDKHPNCEGYNMMANYLISDIIEVF